MTQAWIVQQWGDTAWGVEERWPVAAFATQQEAAAYIKIQDVSKNFVISPPVPVGFAAFAQGAP
jgi:hypothetical protein